MTESTGLPSANVSDGNGGGREISWDGIRSWQSPTGTLWVHLDRSAPECIRWLQDDSALRAGQGEIDATGYVPCAQALGQPMTQCEFGVARAGGGYATVVIKKPHGGTRAIFFRMGKPVGADTSEADGYPEFRATREGSLLLLRVGNER